MIRKLLLAVLVLVLLAWVGWRLLPGPTFAPVVLDETAADETSGNDQAAAQPAPQSSAPPSSAPPARSSDGSRATPTRDRAARADAAERDADVPATTRRGPRGDVRRDLQDDERRGGHTIARHVGQTDEQLRARLARESIAAASTYTDLETAERVVGLTLRRHAARLEQWLAQEGPRANLVLPFAAPRQPPIGRVLRRGAASPVDAHAAVVVLRWRTGDYIVLTSYPEVRPRGR